LIVNYGAKKYHKFSLIFKELTEFGIYMKILSKNFKNKTLLKPPNEIIFV
jgi:hypothetical protein